MGNAPSGGSVSQHVDHAKKTGVCALRDMKLSQFPQQLEVVSPTLRTLDLSTNGLTVLPPSIGEFSNLRTLTLAHNRIGELPEGIGSLKKLESLNLERNGLSSLPDSFVNLKALKTVNLAGNKLESFPLFLCQLVRLDFADLSENAIHELPDGIELLTAVELNLNRNSISVLPLAISRCKRLKVLRLQENTLAISGIPPQVLSESEISLLYVEGNLFEPKELQDIPGYDKFMERYTATKRKAD